MNTTHNTKPTRLAQAVGVALSQQLLLVAVSPELSVRNSDNCPGGLGSLLIPESGPPGRYYYRKGNTIMNTIHNTKTKRLIAALGVTSAAVMAPAALFAGAGTAHAFPNCADPYENGYNSTYCDAFGGQTPNWSLPDQHEYNRGLLDAPQP